MPKNLLTFSRKWDKVLYLWFRSKALSLGNPQIEYGIQKSDKGKKLKRNFQNHFDMI